MILVTGAAGFIGANYVQAWLRERDEPILALDKLTYAGDAERLTRFASDPRMRFVVGDIGDRALMESLLENFAPRAIVNLAAETHVDRSIHAPAAFIATNVDATFALLESVRLWWERFPASTREDFRFVHAGTDEEYGALAPGDAPRTESDAFAPNSPYAASKAAGVHLVRAWHRTFDLPAIITHSTNNYGPFQHREKLIPRMIAAALAGEPLPIYGDGLQVRDWIHVEDHCAALRRVLDAGRPGTSYNIGVGEEHANLALVRAICSILDRLKPRAEGGTYGERIRHVADRPGHDRRYAIDASRLRVELDWRPEVAFADGLERTVAWYLGAQA